MCVLDGLFSVQLISAYDIPSPGKTYELHIGCGTALQRHFPQRSCGALYVVHSALLNVISFIA